MHVRERPLCQQERSSHTQQEGYRSMMYAVCCLPGRGGCNQRAARVQPKRVSGVSS